MLGVLQKNDPTGTRIPIAAVKGQCPNRLDDRAEFSLAPETLVPTPRYPPDRVDLSPTMPDPS